MSSKRGSRRGFLAGSAAAGAVGLGDWRFLNGLAPVSAAETRLPADVVTLRPEIEPVVRLIEETPRDQLLEVMANRIKGGLSYREVLAALLLAGVKNIEPRPSVGFKFHAVLVVNSAHLASISSPPDHRWLPIFWALDHYKSSAQRDVEERGDWTMSHVDETRIPRPHQAVAAFQQAMENWDESAADVAIASLARSHGAQAVYELLFRYGCRDFRSIGHKAIYVANSYRTLQCIGWQHAEPVLRSLVYALLMHEGDNPKDRDDVADRPFRRNVELLGKIPSDWQAGDPDEAATRDVVAAFRDAGSNEACDLVVRMLNNGAGAHTVWDAMFVVAGELLMRQPAIVALHAVTTTNATHFAFQQTGNDETRKLLMLQNAAFLSMFRDAMGGRGQIADRTIDTLLEGNRDPARDAGKELEAVFAHISGDPDRAAQHVVRYLRDGKSATELMNAARLLVFTKGNDAHDYKFSSAILEDYYHVSPTWRDIYLAANVYKLQSSTQPDNQLIERARAALA